MSKLRDLLRRKRAAQIAKMEGRPILDEAVLDAQIDDFKKRKHKHVKKPMPSRLHLTNDARKRMAQRGMSLDVVYAIWRIGTVVPQPDGREIFVVTREALKHADAVDVRCLVSWTGSAILVQPSMENNRSPALITVLADGDDTTFVGRKSLKEYS